MSDDSLIPPDPANAARAPILHLGGRPPPAPDWFREALAQVPDRVMVEVEGAAVEMLVWGRRGDPGLLLLHGFSAHADWWSFIAPILANGGDGGARRVAALSFSGMGGSGRRESYSAPLHALEARAAARAAGLYDSGEAPVVVGHSYGGMVTMLLAHDHTEEFKAFVIIDTPFDPRDSSTVPVPAREHRVYASQEVAVARFRFAPPQPCDHPFTVDHIARTSLTQVQGEGGQPGWVWSFDPFLRAKMIFTRPERLARPPSAPVAYIQGAWSELLTPERKAYARSILPPDAPWFEIPAARHHVMADQPLATVAALEGLLSVWPKS